MKRTNSRMEMETARCTRAIATRRSNDDSRSIGQSVKPSSTAPRPNKANDMPVPITRQPRSSQLPDEGRAATGSFKGVGSFDFDQQFAAAHVCAQHQRLGLGGEQAPHAGKEPLVIGCVAQVHLEGF